MLRYCDTKWYTVNKITNRPIIIIIIIIIINCKWVDTQWQ
jgi:hypothetical protein